MHLDAQQSKHIPIAAIIVGYRPDLAVLDSLLKSLLQQAALVVYFDNGGGEGYLADCPSAKAAVLYRKLEGNKGLGYALNEGIRVAAEEGFRLAATFDQDSEVPPLFLDSLYKTFTLLESQGSPVAAVGPRFYDRRESCAKKFPLYREEKGSIVCLPNLNEIADTVEVDVMITSGMVVNVQASATVLYNPDLIVDHTDTDWCFRARAAGYQLFVSLTTEMGHALSDAPPIRKYGRSFLRYSPLRRYYYFRNTVYLATRSYVSWAWKRRLLVGLGSRMISSSLIDEQRWLGFKMSVVGLTHGLFGKLGFYDKQKPDGLT